MNVQGWVMFDSKKIFCIISFFSIFSAYAMVYDCRFIPLLARPQLMFDGKQHSYALDCFMATASSATSNDQSINIPTLFGTFDQKKYADGMVKAGFANPLRPEWQGQSIPWVTPGKLQAQGVAFSLYTPLWPNWVYTGLNCFFMHVTTYTYFNQESIQTVSGSDNKQELDERRRLMFNQVGLNRFYSSQFGFSDIDWFIRVGHFWSYAFKCRSFDVGARLGVLVPSGKKHNLQHPTSIPFGGNGHWGIYGTLDGLFEVREDLKVGYIVRVSKRFAKTSCQRLTVNDEPGPLGIITGNARVNPGFTFIFSPFIALENLREGMGASIQYTMTKHLQDTWTDARCDKDAVPVCLKTVQDLSTWGSDYFTLNVFYDFGKMKVNRTIDPVISFRWDIPAALYVTENIPNTQRISIGIECVF